MNMGRLCCSLLTALLVAAHAEAQSSPAIQCEVAANERKARWAQASHTSLADQWEHQAGEIALAWCRMEAVSGREKVRAAEDLGRLIFTGEGFHPVIGTVARQWPCSGRLLFALTCCVGRSCPLELWR